MTACDFFAKYLRTSIHLVAITPDGPITGKFFGEDAASAAAWAAEQNLAGRNIYWTVNVSSGGDKKPSKADITSLRFYHVDVDPPKNGQPWDKEAALQALIARGNPSFVIDSGNGLQALWRHDALSTDQAAVEDVNRGLELTFAGDHCWNIDRLLRVPGTTNWPDAKKLAAGRLPSAATIASVDTGFVFPHSVMSGAFPAPPREEVVKLILKDEYAEGYTGDSMTDEELIIKMTAPRGGLAAFNLGDKATVRDLWTADHQALAKAYPPKTGDSIFDHSAADAALMAHLAFWCGKNPVRMDRLFRMSALMRDKYNERGDTYRVPTITRAVSGCRSVYNVPPKEPKTPKPDDKPTPQAFPLPGTVDDANPFGEFLTIPDQQAKFDKCVYVAQDHGILTKNGDILKPDRFNAMFGGHQFIMSADGSGPTKKAFEAFTENRAWVFPKVSRTTFDPRRPFGEIAKDEVNTYFPDPFVSSIAGDVTPMMIQLEKMLPNERDRKIFLTWCAALVQFPGYKFQWAIMLQGVEGNGKGMWAEILKYSVGLRYYHKPFADDITNKFNDFMDRKIFIDVQEITLEDRYNVMENLKEWITSNYIEVQPKGGAKRMIQNWANWMLTTNHKNALPITPNQRRIAPMFTDQQTATDIERCGMSGDYFPKLWAWLRGGGYAHMTHFLMTYPLDEEFNPAGTGPAAARAPKTSSTAEAEGASMGRAEQEILEACASSMQGFRNGWISSTNLATLFKDKGIRMAPQKQKNMLDALGYKELGRASRIVMEEFGKRPVLYVERTQWKEGLSIDDYCRAQGYATT